MVITTWTLIIMWTHVDHRTSPTIEHIPGFKSQIACVHAGNAVLKEIAKGRNNSLVKAICVDTE
jgi:hypothetical protein